MANDDSDNNNLIKNGSFDGGTNNDTDRDPNEWIASEGSEPKRVRVNQNGWLAFNSGKSGTGGQIKQVVDIPTGRMGKEVTFSFRYKELGLGFSKDVSVDYSIYAGTDLTVAPVRTGTVKVPNSNTNANDRYETIPVTRNVNPFTATASQYTIVFKDSSSGDNWDNRDILIDDVVFSVPCFCSCTLIETDHGPVAIEHIRTGDLVRTRDNGFQPVRWIGSRKLTAAQLQSAPNLLPVRIRANALGPGLPAADLFVSPQHRILIRSAIARRMFGAEEVLSAAKHLCPVEGIEITEEFRTTRYFHMLFDRHEVIFSNGAETESLYTGPEAIKSVGHAACEEIFALFPDLRNQGPAEKPLSARPFPLGREARRMAERHAKNNKQLVAC